MDKKGILTSLSELRNKIAIWLGDLAKGLEPGRFRFCKKGSLVPVSGKVGQFTTCFAMKIAWQSGVWDTWTDELKRECTDFIKSFQREDGFFHDSWLENKVSLTWKDLALILLRRTSWALLRDRKIHNVTAETRQSAATLLMVGDKPLYPLPSKIRSPIDVQPYIESLNWTNPWSAGSHLSHQMVFLTVNYYYFNIRDYYNETIDAILRHLDKIRDPITGTWFKGNPPDNIKINGAMKILSGLQWLNRPYPDCTKLLDFALNQPFHADGCNFLNRLFGCTTMH